MVEKSYSIKNIYLNIKKTIRQVDNKHVEGNKREEGTFYESLKRIHIFAFFYPLCSPSTASAIALVLSSFETHFARVTFFPPSFNFPSTFALASTPPTSPLFVPSLKEQEIVFSHFNYTRKSHFAVLS